MAPASITDAGIQWDAPISGDTTPTTDSAGAFYIGGSGWANPAVNTEYLLCEYGVRAV